MMDLDIWQAEVQDRADALTGGSTVTEVIEVGIAARSVELAGGEIDRTILDPQIQAKLDDSDSASEIAELIALGATIPPAVAAAGGSYIGEVGMFPVVNPFMEFTTADGGTWLPSGNVIPVAQAPSLADYDQFCSVATGNPVFSGDGTLTASNQKTLIHNGANAAILFVMPSNPDPNNTVTPYIWATLDNGTTWARRTINTGGAGGIRLLGWRWDGTGFRIFWRVQNSGVFQHRLTLTDLAAAGPYSVTSITPLASESTSIYGAGIVWDGSQYIFCGLNSIGSQITVSTSADGVTFSSTAVRTVTSGLTSGTQPRACAVYYTDRLVVVAGGDNVQCRGTYSTDGGTSFSPSYLVPGTYSNQHLPQFTDYVYEGGSLYMNSSDASLRVYRVYSNDLSMASTPNLVANANINRTSSRVVRLGVGEYLFCGAAGYSDSQQRPYIQRTTDSGATWQLIPLVNTTGVDFTYTYFAEMPSGGFVVVAGNSIFRIADLNATHVGIIESAVVGLVSGNLRTYQCVRIG